ncbi:MAG: DNA polymerase III subunit, partial [Bacteroidales bacterium]|nr:DNA polymerase III subunit [Bacteroidales bacterium]
KYEKLIHPDLHFIFPVAKVKEVKDKEVSSQNAFYLKKWREALDEKDYHLSPGEWYEKIGIENKQGMINTNDARSILDTLNYKSYEAEYKVMVIWMVEYLYHAAAPRILKILEEPPEKTLFLLVANHSDQIISTILSRAQTIKISPYSENALQNYLINKMNAGHEQAQRAAKLANGDLFAARQFIRSSEIEEFNFEQFRQWMRICFSADFMAIHDFVGKVSKLVRERQKSFLHFGMTIIRKSMLLNYSGEKLVRLSDMEDKFVRDFSPFINEKNLDQLYEELNNAVYHIERNAKAEILFTDLSIKVSRLLHAGKK